MECLLAQVNLAKMNVDIDDPIMSGFVQRLDEINAMADGSKDLCGVSNPKPVPFLALRDAYE